MTEYCIDLFDKCLHCVVNVVSKLKLKCKWKAYSRNVDKDFLGSTTPKDADRKKLCTLESSSTAMGPCQILVNVGNESV